jgi:ParB-like chromosome segregation protein Spo0J
MNPKIHPKTQQDALAGSLNELGWIAPVIVNRVTAHVLDGHARIGLAISRGEPSVPIAYVELSPEQENLAVAIYDPIGHMAATDRDQLSALLDEVSTGDAAVQAMLDALARDQGITPPDFAPVGIDEQGRLDQKAHVVCPECGHDFVPS